MRLYSPNAFVVIVFKNSIYKNKDFVKLLTAQGISDFGDGTAFLGFIMIILYAYSGTALETSIIFICSALPVLIVGPFAGVFVDRWNRKHVMIASDIIRGLVVLLLIFYQTLLSIYLVVFLVSTLSRFFYPARGSIIPNIVGRENVLSANALSQSVMYAMSIISPSVSGLLIGYIGVKIVFLVDAISFFLSAVIVYSLDYSEKVKRRNVTAQQVIQDMEMGVDLIKKTPSVKYIVISFSIIMLFAGAVNVLYLMFIRDVLKLDIRWVGYLETIFGFGAVIGGIFLSAISSKLKNASILLCGTMSGILIALLAVFPYLYLVFVGLFFVGFLMVFINTPPSAIVQRTIADRARGRVLSVMNAVFQLFSIISMLTVSAILIFIDIVHLFMLGGIMLTGLGLLLFGRKKVMEMLG